ncbi:c-type cytochrome [Variovorax sp. HW608]|uniref:c-type cytochrome n=1 Tax=Variovorax sp. HW608 TaxID=1034889 RepID=UPI001E430F58|nr:c-type cytochrome [Variovorax sp. HW608]
MHPSQIRWWFVFAFVACCSFLQSASAADEMTRRMAACTTCHGREGQAAHSDYFPRLAGKPAAYLYEQLRSFRDGRRQQAEMNHLLANLSDAYLREMAGYFAALELPYPPPTPSDLPDAQLARGKALVFGGDEARGIPACVRCHGDALAGVLSQIPGLLGLPRLYIASQLGAWVTGDRRALPPDCMAEVGRKLNNEDIRAVAGWLAAQPVPTGARPAASLPRALPVACSAKEAHR